SLEHADHAFPAHAFERRWNPSLHAAFNTAREFPRFRDCAIENEITVDLVVRIHGVHPTVHSQAGVRVRPGHDGEQVRLAVDGMDERILQNGFAAAVAIHGHLLRDAAVVIAKVDNLDLVAKDILSILDIDNLPDAHEADNTVTKAFFGDDGSRLQ